MISKLVSLSLFRLTRMKGADCTVVVRNLINMHALTRCPVYLVLHVSKAVTLWYPVLHEEQVRTLQPEPINGRRGTGWRRVKERRICARNPRRVGDVM